MNDSGSTRDDFVEGMSRAAFTVSLVTTDGPAGRAGLTVSAMTSVSADPPSILVCVNRQSRFASKVQGNGCFCISILAKSHQEIANSFAGRTDRDDRFSVGKWIHLSTMAPGLSDAVANFDCSLIDVNPVGSHDIAIGLVEAMRLAPEPTEPLIYHQRNYVRLAKDEHHSRLA